MRARCTTSFILLSLLGMPAFAQVPDPTIAGPALASEVETAPISLVLASEAQSVSQFAVDDVGTESDRGWWMDARLTAGTTWIWDRSSLQLDLEIRAPSFLGETSAIGTARGDDTFNEAFDINAAKAVVIPQRLQLTQRFSAGTLKVGHQSYGWGHGLLARSGHEEQDFGWSNRNNLVERIAFGTKPFATTDSVPAWLQNAVVFAAADCVYRDDNADLLRGDVALAAALGIKFTEESWSAGLLQSARFQRDRFDENFPDESNARVTAWTTDVFFTIPLLSDGTQHRLTWESEAAVILGRTTRPFLQETFESGAKLRATGALSRVRYQWTPHVDIKLEAGYASGDNDPRDDVYRSFSFHSDYAVGTVLFDHVMPMLTARSVDRIHDPSLLDQAPASTRFLVNQGTVRNARYFYPVVRWHSFDALELRAAYLLVGSAGDLIDAYQSGILGGYNHSYDAKPSTSRFLGQEFSLSARLYLGDASGPRTSFTAEGGVLLPGTALASLQPDPVSLVRASLSIPW